MVTAANPSTVTVRFRGPGSRAAQLADLLRRERLEVRYTPPMEKRSIGTDVAVVLLYVADKVADETVGVSVDAVVRKVVASYKERFPEADVEIEEAEGDI
jgi:hypothetical protein